MNKEIKPAVVRAVRRSRREWMFERHIRSSLRGHGPAAVTAALDELVNDRTLCRRQEAAQTSYAMCYDADPLGFLFGN